MIPAGWKKLALEDLAALQTGISVSANRPIDDPIRVPYLRVANVQDGHLDLTEIKTIELAKGKIERYLLRKGDVLLTEGGDYDKLGRGCVWNGDIPQCVHQNHVFAIRTDDSRLDARFFSAQATSEYGKHYFRSCSKQTTNLASINSTQLRQFPVLLPKRDEQNSIVEILTTWDRGIEQLDRLIAAKEKRKRALMQQLLTGKLRFLEFVRSNNLHETPLGSMAEDWPIKQLGAVFKRVRRKNQNGLDLVLTASGEYGLVDQKTFFNRNVAGASLEGYCLLRRGEFAYNRSAMSGYSYGAVKRLEAHDEGAVSTLYHCFALDADDSDSDFYVHFFEIGLLNRQLRQICQVGGRSHGLLNVTAGDFEKMLIPVPCKKEQNTIAKVLDACDEELNRLRSQLEALKVQKKELMRKLLTGEVRVPMED